MPRSDKRPLTLDAGETRRGKASGIGESATRTDSLIGAGTSQPLHKGAGPPPAGTRGPCLCWCEVEERDTQRRQLRATFEQLPELYDRARPRYPPQVFDDVVALGRLPDAARVVEIGCGTGQATLALAERRYQITCVELGEQLAAVARRNLVGFPDVEVINADFETWQPRLSEFDAVLAFTAFHWIAPEVRYAKAASLLRDHGVLGVVSTEHVLPPGGDDFFLEVQEDYEAAVPDDPATKAGGPKPPDTIRDLREEIVASGRFLNIAARRYLWDVAYTAEEYIGVLNTYSSHRALDGDTRERLLARIRRRVEARPRGQVRKTYLAMLNIAERR
jgi:SAM-dependent methyltransferase